MSQPSSPDKCGRWTRRWKKICKNKALFPGRGCYWHYDKPKASDDRPPEEPGTETVQGDSS
jgi:hypothetical protein